MKTFSFFLIFLFLFNLTCFADNNLKIEIIGQKTIENNTHNFLYNKKIKFRITNNLKEIIFVKGIQADEFYPIGFFVRFDGYTKKWESPFKNNKIPEFKNLNVAEINEFELKPGESLVFFDLLKDSDPKIEFKRIVYISIKDSNSSPKIFETPLFHVKKQDY